MKLRSHTIKSFALFALSAGLIFSACTKEIKPNLRTTTPTLVIEGNITNLPGPYTVKLSQSVVFYDSNNVVPVSGGHIRISDNAGNTDSLLEVSPGVYHTTSILGVAGRSYHLSVNSGGKQYDAYSTMPTPVPLAGISGYPFSDPGGKTRVFCYVVFIDPIGIPNYYNAYLYINGRRQSKANPGNDQGVDGKITEYFLNSDSTVKIKDTIIGELDAIDMPMFNYWNTLTNSTLSSQTAAPGNPTSNISNNALGYFSAYAPTYSDTAVIDSFTKTGIATHSVH